MHGPARRPPRTGLLWTGAALLLLLPALAMQVTDEVRWTAADFLAAGLLLGTSTFGLHLALGARRGVAFAAGAAAALGGGLVALWANLAVGLVGPEGAPLNHLFTALVPAALAGALAVRARPAPLARVLTATAAAWVAAALLALARTGDPDALLAGLLALPFLLAAVLFDRAARA